MSVLERLLAEGRAILQQRELEQEKQAEKERQEQDRCFREARKAALQLLAPLGGELLVQPVSAGGCRHLDEGVVLFWLEPFPGVRVWVKVRRYCSDWIDDSKYRSGNPLSYHVDWRWSYDATEDHGIYPDGDQETATLAEAVALAEQAVPRRQKAQQDYEAARQRGRERMEKRATTPSVEEQLLELLARFVRSCQEDQ